VRNAEKGFTLIEMMITVAIVAILAAIAYPSYMEYVMRSRRVEGQNLLNDAAARQERYRAQNSKYSSDVAKLKLPYGNGSASEHGYYTLSTATSDDGSTFTLTATRAGPQIADSKCGNFTLDDKGVKDIAAGTPGTAALCWR
jgi:type IV pilus assembly protein PilE